jgi:hypothetical protein
MITANLKNRSLTSCRSIGKLNPFGEDFERFLCWNTLYPRVIHPFDLKSRVKKMIGQITIIRKNNKTSRIPVESTNRKIGAVVLSKIICNRATPLWI